MEFRSARFLHKVCPRTRVGAWTSGKFFVGSTLGFVYPLGPRMNLESQETTERIACCLGRDEGIPLMPYLLYFALMKTKTLTKL